MVQTSTLKSFKALRDYQLAPSIKKGTTPKIAEKYNLNKKVFETAIKSADVAVPGFRRKIPLKFGDEAERKRAANKKETAAQKKFSQATLEKFYAGPTGSGIQKSHMGDKFFTEVTARNLGYAPAVINQEALKEFDDYLPTILNQLNADDVLMITADHGCDPTFPGSEHTREYVPVIAYQPGMQNTPLGERNSFADIGQTLAQWFNLPALEYGDGFLNKLNAPK